jgi:glycosyltransferase involved in cell wall biosynthesis|tara:strand:+ start:27220 stop:28263 length:1044 start_codon:yes stop_codon:yes gene_type:complete
MTNIPKLPQGRALVTFALFAYNQEKFIREAVEGAFSQTYEPLEIILSDDYSSDRTFEIIERMAAEYTGPHRVIVRQSQANRGLVRHIRDVVEIASGHIVVVAAGDDISFSQRTKELVTLIDEEGSAFAASNYSRIASDGVILNENTFNIKSPNEFISMVNADPKYFVIGAAAAYKKEFLESAFYYAKSTIDCGSLYNEDIVFAAYAVATGSFPSNYKDSPLIGYRISSSSLSNFRVAGSSFNEELSLVYREKFISSARLASLNAVLEIAQSHPNLYKKVRHQKIECDIRRCSIQVAAFNPKFTNRLIQLSNAKSLEELRIMLSRLFGCRFLATLRYGKNKLLGSVKW